MLASIIVDLIKWILSKVFWFLKGKEEEIVEEHEEEKQAKTAADTFDKDKAAATTKKESADAGKNMLNS